MGVLRGVRVVVAGAGLAGLTAAAELARRGAAVRVVEARDRLGGRVWTLRDERGRHVEAGGEFIDSEHQALRALVRGLHLPLVRVLRDGFGAALAYDNRLHVSASQVRVWRGLRRLVAPAAKAFQAAGQHWSDPVAAAIARHSLADVLDRQRAPADVRAAADALHGFYLAAPDALSCLVLVEQALADVVPGRSAMYRVEGGNDRLVAALARKAGRITLDTAVRAVESAGHSVRVRVTGADGAASVLHADYVVMTLPAPLLAECRFDPPVDASVRRAWQGLSSGAATKAFLDFDWPWWRKARRPRAFGSNLDVGAVWESAEEQPDAAVLTLMAGGRASVTLQRRLKAGVSKLVEPLAFLGRASAARLFAPPVIWERERWSRGGYAVFGPQFDPRWRALLARNHGRVLFAGEHTSGRWQGFMNGAVESGQRAALDIERLEALQRWSGRA